VNSTFQNNHNGIYLKESQNITISKNLVEGSSYYGIFLELNCDNNTIEFNELFNNALSGILMHESKNNTIISNEILNSDYGLYLSYSDSNIISLNVLEGSIEKIFEENSNNNRIGLNIINGYYTSLIIDDDGGTDHAFTWEEAAQLSWCTGIGSLNDPYYIKNLTINAFESGSGIEIIDSDVYFIIANCTVMNSGTGTHDAGIKLDHANKGTLLQNNCSINNKDGIRLEYSDNSLLKNNFIKHNTKDGIRLHYSDNNTILQNNCSNNDVGIFLWYSNNNSVIENDLISNSDGIRVSYSENNNISYNYAFNSTSFLAFGILINLNSHFNIIANNIILNTSGSHGHGICIEDSNYNEVLRNIAQFNEGYGIKIDTSTNCIVVLNNLSANNDGCIDEVFSSSNTIGYNLCEEKLTSFTIDGDGSEGFTWEQAAQYGMVSGSGTYSHPYIIEELDVDGQFEGSCITISDSNVYYIIQNCTCINSGDEISDAGINLKNARNGKLVQNNCSLNGNAGIIVENSNNCSLTHNIVEDNDYEGIYVFNSQNITLNYNNVSSNGQYGIFVKENCANTVIMHNLITLNSYYGLYLESTDNCTIYRNNVSENGVSGFMLYLCDGHNITENEGNNNQYGIYLLEGDQNVIVNNTFNDNSYYGVYIQDSNDNIVSLNELQGNDQLYYVDNCAGSAVGFNLHDGKYTALKIDANGGTSMAFTWEQALTMPWCSGAGIWNNPYILSDFTVDGLGNLDAIFIKDSSDFFRIQNCTCVNSGNNKAGIHLFNTDNGLLIDNNCSANYYGIRLTLSANNTLSENWAEYNSYAGIYISDSHNNTIVNNLANANSFYGIELIADQTHDNNLSLNQIHMNNYDGIYIWSAGISNLLSFNNITNNRYDGIYVGKTNQLMVTNNNIEDNGNYGGYGLYLDSSNSSLITLNTLSNNFYGCIYQKDTESTTEIMNLCDGYYTTISIDNNGPDGFTWSEASQYWWCSGSGTWADPYLISDLTFNKYSSENGIIIRDSDVYFLIENCTLINFDEGSGLYLLYTSNGKLIGNNCTANNIGISVFYGQNNTLIGNDLSVNDHTGIFIKNSNNNTIVQNHASDNICYGLQLMGSSSTYNNISLNEFHENSLDGVYIWKAGTDNLLSYNDIKSNIYDGIYAGFTNELRIIHNVLQDNGFTSGYGTYLDSSNESIISLNTFINNNEGCLYEENTEGNAIGMNLCEGFYTPITIDVLGNEGFTWSEASSLAWCTGTGSHGDPYYIKDLVINGQNSMACIKVMSSLVSYFVIENCTCYNAGSDTSEAGIALIYANNGQLLENNCSNNSEDGIYLYNVNNIHLIGNIINYNGRYGVFLISGDHNNISSNQINNNDANGLYSYYSHNSTIVGNNFSANAFNGVGLFISEDNEIRDNDINNNFQAIRLSDSNDNNITHNRINDNDLALYLDSSNNTMISMNILLDNDEFLVEINCKNTKEGMNKVNGYYTSFIIDGNALEGFTWAIASLLGWCTGSGTWNDPFVIENIVINGKKERSAIEIKNTDGEYFVIRNCTCFNSSELSSQAGIKLSFASNGRLDMNNVSFNNADGIMLHVSTNITVSNNLIANNLASGITLASGCTENYIVNNTITGNTDTGIYIYGGSSNKLYLNNVTDNGFTGITISQSHSNNNVSMNTIHNHNRAISLSNTLNDVFYKNNISQSTVAFYLSSSNGSQFISNLLFNVGQFKEEINSNNNVYPMNLFDGVLTAIIIDEDGLEGITWSEASEYSWCSGSGTQLDPYIIEDLIIDGQGSTNGILIENSEVFFIIQNCTCYNSAPDVGFAGIKLSEVDNGQLIENNCSNNNEHGIYLSRTNNTLLIGNIVHNNLESGIWLYEECVNNTLFNNSLYGNGENGVYLTSCNYNNVSLNLISDNDQYGIYLYNSNKTIVFNNTISSNQGGIYAGNSYYNNISENT
ncbi:MAG: hypothetical protein EU548_03260, partial [Promethearchaeota archaeon]